MLLMIPPFGDEGLSPPTHSDDGNVKHDRYSGSMIATPVHGPERGSYRAREHCDPQIVVPFIPQMTAGIASELMPVGVEIRYNLHFSSDIVE